MEKSDFIAGMIVGLLICGIVIHAVPFEEVLVAPSLREGVTYEILWCAQTRAECLLTEKGSREGKKLVRFHPADKDKKVFIPGGEVVVSPATVASVGK